ECASLRLRKGTAMLLDRACRQGGWNAGNSIVWGVPLDAHLDTTAAALLAFDGAERHHPTVQAGISWLQKNVESCHSLYSLAWSMLALKAHDQFTDPISDRIATWASSGEASNTVETMALACLGLLTASGNNALI